MVNMGRHCCKYGLIFSNAINRCEEESLATYSHTQPEKVRNLRSKYVPKVLSSKELITTRCYALEPQA